MCRVYRGLPNAPALDSDMAAGVVNVTVVADEKSVQNVTRYPRRWIGVAPVPASLVVAVDGKSAHFSGMCRLGQLAGVAIDGAVFPYAVQANDSPATVASNLAAIIREAGVLVEYADISVAAPGSRLFSARVVEGAGALQEIKRQRQDFSVSLWCPGPAFRDAVARSIDEALATQNFLPLADGSAARLVYSGTSTSDVGADATVYRRDIVYSAEYPTTISDTTPAMLFGTASLSEAAIFVKNLFG
jgi:hypothetical protein